jgi:hypothetical protein
MEALAECGKGRKKGMGDLISNLIKQEKQVGRFTGGSADRAKLASIG